jgi:hypothetical protein
VLQRAGAAQRLVGRRTSGGGHVDQGHPAGSDGAGLVQHDGVHAAGGFEHDGSWQIRGYVRG